jgi:ABC-type glycerol-3-phosphate transport system substrate-binding protein
VLCIPPAPRPRPMPGPLAAEACHKAGVPFGIGLGTTSDSVDTAGALFAAFEAVLVDPDERITVRSDQVRQAMEHCAKLAAFYPKDAPAWDDASNNKWLVAGKGPLIMNPPSAWAVAVRDAPQVTEQCCTMACRPDRRAASGRSCHSSGE